MNNQKPKKLTNIGGQAVIEGVMMRGPECIATSVRKADGEIVVVKKPYKSFAQRIKLLKLPVIRGVVAFFESMIIGMKSLMVSADYFDLGMDDQDYKPSKFELFLNKLFGDKFQDVLIFFSLALSMVFGIGLFVIIPNVLANLTFGKGGIFYKDGFMYNIVEGIVRIVIFFLYIALISRLKDIQRVFEYHGAEHKTIHCYEHEESLTVENVKKHSVLHPRCGTSFLLIVMIVSIAVFSFFLSDNFLITLSMRIAMLPVVAGLSYEIIKVAGRSENKLVGCLNVPGMWMQRFTTREPDEKQIEVAIKSLESVMVEDKEADKW